MSRRCIPFGWSEEDLAEINAYIGESKLMEAVNNVQLLANINGVGVVSGFRVMFSVQICVTIILLLNLSHLLHYFINHFSITEQ